MATGIEIGFELDIDIAVIDRSQIPRSELTRAGFSCTGTFEHSENWLGPGATPVRFTDDSLLREAVLRASPIAVGGVPLPVISAEDLLHAKLRAAADTARRRSKLVQDLADAQALIEQHPGIADSLSAAERELLGRVRL